MMFAIILGVVIGCIGILNMVANAKLAERIGIFHGTLINYCGASVILLFIIFNNHISWPSPAELGAVPWWVYFGGPIGVAVVAGLNVIVPRLPVMFSALITFLGQMTASIIIDWMLGHNSFVGNVVGGVLIACGLLYNSYIGKEQ
ncbi:DMT family transporter [Sporomusa malonica]|uniref:Transporter family-2 protein n=1 Tax=Sporomusa malonica TaxID=112901 RepID=A0A1W2DQ07_9FIRM|nr:DMT family transporter [Sporomusa malonica]SMC99146.1 transporter family-2 protein [Sporomusa malonica]